MKFQHSDGSQPIGKEIQNELVFKPGKSTSQINFSMRITSISSSTYIGSNFWTNDNVPIPADGLVADNTYILTLKEQSKTVKNGQSLQVRFEILDGAANNSLIVCASTNVTFIEMK